MDKSQIESSIMEAIGNAIANNKGSLAATLHLDVADVERGLERMKRKGMVRFNVLTKSWEIHGDSTLRAPSEVSAPTNDEGVGSSNAAAPVGEGGVENTNMNTNDATSKLDAAINAAKARKESKEGTAGKPKLSPEEKAQREAARLAEREAKKLERTAKREAKLAAKQASASPAHMKKVDKAAAKLPRMEDAVERFFNELTVNFTGAQLATLSAHLGHFNRTQATKRALDQKVAVGSRVRITGGDARFLGKEGVVSKAQRIRCYVTLEGVKKDVYLFTSDVEVLEEIAQATAANG